jgi:ribosomal protein L32E
LTPTKLASAQTSERVAQISLNAANVRATSGVTAAQALSDQNVSDADLAATRAAWAQRLTDLRGRASSDASSLSIRAVQFRAASDAYNPQRSDYDDQGDWNKSRSKDQKMESQAKGAEKLADSAQKLNDQLTKMKPEQLASVFDSITKQLAALDSAVKAAEQRSKHQ